MRDEDEKTNNDISIGNKAKDSLQLINDDALSNKEGDNQLLELIKIIKDKKKEIHLKNGEIIYYEPFKGISDISIYIMCNSCAT